MHKSTHDRPLTDVHWPIHRGWCRGSGTKGDLSTSTGDTHRGAGRRTEAIIHITTRGLDRIIDRTIRMSTRAQEAKGYGPLERNNINTACRLFLARAVFRRVFVEKRNRLFCSNEKKILVYNTFGVFCVKLR